MAIIVVLFIILEIFDINDLKMGYGPSPEVRKRHN